MTKFTDMYVKNLKAQDMRYEIREGNGNGFALRISPNGKKSWLFLYSIAGRQRRMTLGFYPLVSLSEARAKHLDAYKIYKSGKDPAYIQKTEHFETMHAMNMKGLIDEYIEKWAIPRKKSWKEDKRILEKELKPWLFRKAQDITKRDMISLLEDIEKRASIMANRTFAAVRRMFNFAVERDILQISPCNSVKLPAQESQRERVLNEEEINRFWYQFKATKLIEFALHFQLITAQRKKEILSAEWNDIDFNNKTWNIPGSKTKNGKPHSVPLCDLAIEILETIKALNISKKLIFSSFDELPFDGNSLARAIQRNQKSPGPLADLPNFTPHDLRRTAATHMSSLGVNRLIISKILNHTDSHITAIYDRHSYDAEKREALEKWSKKLSSIVNID